jgi:hypothetical protein
MDCGVLDTVLNGDCPTPFQGFKSQGYILDWKDIDQQHSVVVDGAVALVLAASNAMPIFDYSQKPFKGVKVSGKQLEYSAASDIEIMIPLNSLSQVNTQNAHALVGGKKVLVLEQYGVDDAERFVIFGLSKGLKSVINSEPEANKIGYLATLSSMDCINAQLIVNDFLNLV